MTKRTLHGATGQGQAIDNRAKAKSKRWVVIPASSVTPIASCRLPSGSGRLSGRLSLTCCGIWHKTPSAFQPRPEKEFL